MSVMVDIRPVHKSFGSPDVPAGTDLQVRAGEVTVVPGPSGSGEPTLLFMAGGRIVGREDRTRAFLARAL
ncbi:hypothetical protein [Streptomyces sp. NRRL S-1022]|uniref:hypothetical protein n=1 Tax=Streptomyces sp. NRRL S-1022 TaxID=1463880 RepID=UPI0004C010DB|nr:hypothetical protein [Streptomyces sp. NRRL S-1022]